MKLVRNIKLVIFIGLIYLFNSCTDSNNSGSAIKNEQNTKSIYKDQLKIEYSKSFEIKYLDSAKVINVFSPDKSKQEIFQYLLLPNNVGIPQGYDRAQIIRTPVNTAIVLTSIYVGFLDKLNLTEKIIAVDNSKYICQSNGIN